MQDFWTMGKRKDDPKDLYWKAYCRGERIEAVSGMEKIVNNYGYITDYKMFSDFSISLRIELKESDIDPLYEALKSLLTMDPADPVSSGSTCERTVFLSVTFLKGHGDLSIENPAVPG